jgi:hypothetical protein
MLKPVYKYHLIALLVLSLNGIYGNTYAAMQPDRENYLKERLFLITDRNIYFTGENIWIKFICTERIYNMPLDLSKVVYYELLTADNNPVSRHKTGLKGGFGSGCITLPEGLAPGNYRIRAYTNWMKNFGHNCFFDRLVIIINPDEEVLFRKPLIKGETKITAGFFPESGRIIRNLDNHIVMRVTDSYNEGVDGRGLLYLNNDTLQAFDIVRGIGAFDLKPLDTGKYYVRVITDDSVQASFTLPEVHEEGTAVHLSSFTDKTVSFTISSSLYDNKDTNRSIKINIEKDGYVFYSESLYLSNSVQTVRIPDIYIPEGIYFVTLLDDKDVIVCRRPVYKEPRDKLDLDIAVDKAICGTREKVNITVRTSVNGSPVSANLAVKVKKSGDPFDSEETDLQNRMILDNIWPADISDFYLDPVNFGYSEINDALPACIDSAGTLPGDFKVSFLPEIQGQIISGKVTDKLSKEPLCNIEVYLSYVGPHAQIYICKTNRAGEFSFSPGGEFSDNEMVIQLDDKKGKYILLLNDKFSNTFKEQHPQPALKSEYKDYILRCMINRRITAAYERDSAHVFKRDSAHVFDSPGTAPEQALSPANGLRPKTWALSPFYGDPDESITLSDYIKLPVMEEVLVELLKSVYISVRKGIKYIHIIDKNNNEIIGNSPLYLIDGVPVFDPSVVLNLEPASVKNIRVVSSKYYYGDMIFDGILDIQTHDNKFENVAKLKTAIRQKPENGGCNEVFTSPRYDTEKTAGSRIPDYRNTVYWNPEIIPDKQGTASFSFYTSDDTGHLDIIVEGITNNGQAGCGKFQIEVK